MNNLYEYIDPIASPYEAFLFDSTRDSLPIPAHWHYYVELLYVLKGEIEVSHRNGRIRDPFSAQMRSFHRACKRVCSGAV